jgi:hypothetical protein
MYHNLYLTLSLPNSDHTWEAYRILYSVRLKKLNKTSFKKSRAAKAFQEALQKFVWWRQ